MEISYIRGMNELGMDQDPAFINQWHLNSFADPTLSPFLAAFEDYNLNQSFSYMDTTSPPAAIVRPNKLLKPNGFHGTKPADHHISQQQSVFSPEVLSFTNIPPPHVKKESLCSSTISNFPNPDHHHAVISQDSLANNNYVLKSNQGAKRTNISTSTKLSSSQDHIIAERKRREKLSQRFIALSAVVPGLKKMDKASVLGDATKYLKQLQERIKVLEDQKKKTVESVVILKKSQVFVDGDLSKYPLEEEEEALPEIEARFCDKNVLIRIHCEKKKGILEKTVAGIEKFHLTVTNTSVLAFGTFALDITIIAQMDTEFSLSLKDLVKNLRAAF